MHALKKTIRFIQSSIIDLYIIVGLSEYQLSGSISLSEEEIAVLEVKAKSDGLTIEEYIHKIFSK